jgi:hypothetical protein
MRALSLLALVAVGAALSAPARADKDDRPAPGMKARVFEIKHQDPESLVHALRPLASGAKGAMMNESGSLRAVTVRDFPENLASMEQALKRLDVPSPPKPDVELKIRILLGSPTGGAGQYPSELDGVVKQLSATLSYKAYYLIAAVTQRVRASAGTGGKGHFQIAPPVTDEPVDGHFHFAVDNVSLGNLGQTGNAGPPVISLKKMKLSLEGEELGEAEVATHLTLREGEKVVVGTGSLKNRAMIVVVSARLLTP